MEWGKIGSFGGLFLAGFLIIEGISLIIGGTAIPAWFIGILAVAAGGLIVAGK